MRRVFAVATAVALLALGALLALYGLFAILYRGDSRGSGDTYVTFAGREMDADFAGGVSLVGALVVVLAAVVILTKRRRR
jgi:hypothetical protein